MNRIQSIFFISLVAFLASCSGMSIETKDNFEQVELPDGSIAFLNHNSEIEYNENFTTRTVKIEGEVFFSVIEGQIPFIVKANMGEVEVLGTEFNVNSNNSELSVEVKKGAVQLKTKKNNRKIAQGERAVLKVDGEGIQIGKAELNYQKWINSLKIEFKQMGREIKSNSQDMRKEGKKVGRDIKKEVRKLKLK